VDIVAATERERQGRKVHQARLKHALPEGLPIMSAFFVVGLRDADAKMPEILFQWPVPNDSTLTPRGSANSRLSMSTSVSMHSALASTASSSSSSSSLASIPRVSSTGSSLSDTDILAPTTTNVSVDEIKASNAAVIAQAAAAAAAAGSSDSDVDDHSVTASDRTSTSVATTDDSDNETVFGDLAPPDDVYGHTLPPVDAATATSVVYFAFPEERITSGVAMSARDALLALKLSPSGTQTCAFCVADVAVATERQRDSFLFVLTTTNVSKNGGGEQIVSCERHVLMAR
jgi:hypothetical protein